MDLKLLLALLILVGSAFSVSYGGDAFTVNASMGSTFSINNTVPLQPLVLNQTSATNITVVSAYPFNISFRLELNHAITPLVVNITSPQLACNDYNNDVSYGVYSNNTLAAWQCNATEPAGKFTFELDITPREQMASPMLLSGTYQADVAQPASAPLAYAPDHPMGNNSSFYGASYANTPTVGTTPATTILAMQQLQQREQNKTAPTPAPVPAPAVQPVAGTPATSEAPANPAVQPVAPTPPPQIEQPIKPLNTTERRSGPQEAALPISAMREALLNPPPSPPMTLWDAAIVVGVLGGITVLIGVGAMVVIKKYGWRP